MSTVWSGCTDAWLGREILTNEKDKFNLRITHDCCPFLH